MLMTFFLSHRIAAGNKKQIVTSAMAVQDSERGYPCAQCEYKAKWIRHLKSHIMLIHESEHHPCPQCDYKARPSQYLRQHVKTVHEGVRYPCDLCDYKTTIQQRSSEFHAFYL